MYKIINKKVLNPTVVMMDIEAPLVAKKAEADVICLRDEVDIDQSKPLVLTHPTERWKKKT